MSDGRTTTTHEARIRKGRFFWQGQLVKTTGIPAMTHTYRAFTRRGIEARMARVCGRKTRTSAEWITL